eukprot:GHVH01014767.1.p1 GENE.GHVH01014767.1~~GHVH01014767.1.p1  ORF type:complete len:170 (+),score=16.08 GHVH01014767.1:57-566(+)
MYLILDFWKTVVLKPEYIGQYYEQQIENTLRADMEGNCQPNIGFVIAVIQVLHREKGIVQPGTGSVKVTVKYRALVFNPQRGEVMDAVITEINSLGVFCSCGPLKIFITQQHLGNYEHGKDCWSDRDSDAKLKPGTEVRLRIQGVKYETSSIAAVARIDEDFLGPMTKE